MKLKRTIDTTSEQKEHPLSVLDAELVGSPRPSATLTHFAATLVSISLSRCCGGRRSSLVEPLARWLFVAAGIAAPTTVASSTSPLVT